MNVPTGIMVARLVVRTFLDLISVPVLKDMPSYQTGKHAKVKYNHVYNINVALSFLISRLPTLYFLLHPHVLR